nr:hypothetical protein [Tanacetum cinerariifolium]
STPSLIYTAYPLPNTPYLPLDQKDKLFYVLIPFNFTDIDLPPRDQRHQYRRFKGLEYSKGDITDFEETLGKIYGRGGEGDKVRWIQCILGRECEANPLQRGSECLLEGDLSAYRRGILSEGDFLSIVSSYTVIRDPMLRLYHRLIACSIAGWIQALQKICNELDDAWAWVAPGPKRQPNIVVGAPEVVGGAPIVDE